ncbi:Uncharacterized protein BP5553_10104 [Venustampulla echinocandica]|uniref:DNA-directed RNA polymerase III subunit rpc5 n=1 Tax=Venustampulla echinocandica TaxID=2656787 RepID=A0A370TAC9_9HELO|nr:Uncharacterized protein BP5553_10104 [Venustampulla echinocandica]RDL30759.1 Uncharacterized protein BP5553_10104 [Venustampulla echinocandica]
MGDINMDEAPDKDQDLDPIKTSYDVFIKPRISSDRQIYILQFPNRDSKQPYSAANQSQPLKLRVKPNAGMVEVDVPVDAWRNYDRLKGIQWGESLKKSSMSKGRGSHGLPGGFGIGGAPPGRGRGRGADQDEMATHEKMLNDYAGSMERDEVLTKQTLGGQAVSNSETNPQYMVGTFRKNQLHLTPVDHIVQMRPQFHHIDALAEQHKAAAPRDTPARAQEPRAIHMTVKSSIDGEEDSTDTMIERIAATQAEVWKGHRYIDEDTNEAWEAFEESLFVGGERELDPNELLSDKVPELVTSLDDREYLDAVSAPREEGDPPRLKKSTKGKDKKGKGKAVGGEADGDDAASSSGLSDTEVESEEEAAK